MDNYLITVVFLSFLTKTVLTDADLQQQNADQDQLNPLNDFEDADTTAKAQDKRTIFNSAASNYGWAKHVGYHPSGFKYVLGYTPVNLKYAPVIRPLPVKHQGYYYGKPKLHHVHLRRPVVQIKPPKPVYGVPWKPTTTLVKPVVSLNVPPPPLQLGTAVAVGKPVHVDHLHTHVDHVHTIPHLNHAHKFPVHVDHVHTVPQPVHVHPGPLQPVAHLPQPLVPAVAPHQFIHSPFFEVTKPNLGVLPLGAVFPSPVLRHLPSPPVALPLPLRPALVHQPVLPAAVPLPPPHALPPPTLVGHPPAVPLAPQPIAPQPVYPHGTVVEYHGTTNFINLKGQVPVPPILPQTPVNAGQPHHFYLQYPPTPTSQNIPIRVPEPHDAQTPLVPGNHPLFFQHHQPHFQQQLPQDAPSHFQPVEQGNPHDIFHQQLPANQQAHFQPDQGSPHGIFQQQLPVNQQAHFQPDQGSPHGIFQQQLPVNQQGHFQSDQNNQQNFFQHQLPQESPAQFEPADQVSSQHFFQQPVGGHQGQFQPVDQSDGGYIYQQPDGASAQQAIQPGQTDLQLPIHLPHHPGFVQNSRQFQSGGNLHDPSQFSENVFRPSIQLEPPYKK